MIDIDVSPRTYLTSVMNYDNAFEQTYVHYMDIIVISNILDQSNKSFSYESINPYYELIIANKHTCRHNITLKTL
jgi:hypothetical protein